MDVDVHQGNGTAKIFADDSRVFTFSIHQENNYPVKERSDLDIGLPDRIEDDEYLEHLDRGLRPAQPKTPPPTSPRRWRPSPPEPRAGRSGSRS